MTYAIKKAIIFCSKDIYRGITMSMNLDIFNVFLDNDFTKNDYKKMIERIHSQMVKFSGNEQALEQLTALKVALCEKNPSIDHETLKTPRRYALDEKNLPTLKMGDSNFCLDLNLKDISDNIAKLKPGERIALGRDTSVGNQDGVTKRMDVFYSLGDQKLRPNVVSRRHCDICRNEDGKLELIDMSTTATRVVYNPEKKGLSASFNMIENNVPKLSGKTQDIDEANLPKLKLASVVEFDLADIADDLKNLKNGKCIALGRIPSAGEQTHVAQNVEIGKDNKYISRRHCNIWRINGKLVLEDCSANGTEVMPKANKNQHINFSNYFSR